MRVLCIGDSLGLPRDGCNYEDTWFYKLKQNYPQHEFVDYFTRSLLMPKALEMFDLYYRFYNPDIVILQTGICDSSPRYINDHKLLWKVLLRICNSFSIEKLFWKLVKLKPRSEKCVYTDLNTFRESYGSLVANFIKQNNNNKVIVCLIGKGTPSVISRNKFFNKNADKYNDVIREIAAKYNDNTMLINPLGTPSDDMFVDGYHCNANGMDRVYRDLTRCFDELSIKNGNE